MHVRHVRVILRLSPKAPRTSAGTARSFLPPSLDQQLRCGLTSSSTAQPVLSSRRRCSQPSTPVYSPFNIRQSQHQSSSPWTTAPHARCFRNRERFWAGLALDCAPRSARASIRIVPFARSPVHLSTQKQSRLFGLWLEDEHDAASTSCTSLTRSAFSPVPARSSKSDSPLLPHNPLSSLLIPADWRLVSVRHFLCTPPSS